MAFLKKIGGAVAIGAAMLIGLSAPPAEAGYLVDLTQDGADVVATGSGAIDLTGLTFLDAFPGGPAEIIPHEFILSGFTQAIGIGTGLGAIDLYTGATGPANFGSGGLTEASSTTGDHVGIFGGLAVPDGYVSDSPLSSSATWDAQTFSSLGATPGRYEWTWGSRANQNFTLVIGAVGTSPTNPVLGTVIPCPGILLCYEISGGTGMWFDPPTASGYTYQMTNGSLFTEIADLPMGFLNPFEVTAPGCSISGNFSGGQSVNFVALCGQGVSEFTISGIEPTFDPNDPGAFPIQLDFNTPTADFEAIPLGSVPEPSTWAMMLLGFAGLSFIGYGSTTRRRQTLRAGR